MVKPSFAQSIPTPSIPQFSLKFVDASYDVPTTYTIDPYTGQNVTHQGYHVQKTNFVMLIENQPLVYQFNGSFFYNINVKGHFDANWTQWFSNDEIPLANASSSQTSITLGVLTDGGLTLDSGREMNIPLNGQVDFQVQAMIGGFFKAGFDHTEFSGESSGWSDIQTLNVADGSTYTTAYTNPTPSPSPTPTSTPAPTQTISQTSTQTPTATATVPEIPSLAILMLLMTTLLIGGALFAVRKKNHSLSSLIF